VNNVAVELNSAAFEELGCREHLGAQVERREHPAEHQYQPGMQLPVGEGHARACARTGETNEVLGADIGGKDRRADQEPAGIAAREEIIRGVFFLLERSPHANGGIGNEVQPDNSPIQCSKRNRGPGHGVLSVNSPNQSQGIPPPLRQVNV
jgi:hypothetical protein